MKGINDKMANDKKWTYMDHLGKIEAWLFTISKNLDNVPTTTENPYWLSESCSYAIENFRDVITNGIAIEKRAMILVATLNTFIRVYALDKSRIIMSEKNLQKMIDAFTYELLYICEVITSDDEINTTDTPDLLSSKFASGIRYKRCAADIFDALLTNFAREDLLKKCLQSLFSDEASSSSTVTIRSQSTETLGHIIKCAAVCAGNATIRSVEEFSTKYQSLMRDLRMFMDTFFDDITNLSKDTSYMNTIDGILSLVWNLVDKTTLVPVFVEAGYAQSVVKWIEKLSSGYSSQDLHEQVIAIIHNLSRHKKGLSALRNNDAFQILMKYKVLLHWDNSRPPDHLTQTFTMSLIALATNDNEQFENKDLICQASNRLHHLCEEAAREPSLRSDGFHLSELLTSLEGALLNTAVVRHIFGEQSHINKEPVEFFAQLLISFYGSLLNQEADDHQKLIGKSLLKILLCISSYFEYQEELSNHDQFCVLIESLTRRPKQDIAKRIWGNHELYEKSKRPPPPFKINRQPMIYISYNWTDVEFCQSFVAKLSNFTKVPIWVDYKNASWFDDMWDHLAPAIESATMIIVLVSSAYSDSKNNFQELSYAVALAKVQSRNENDSIIFVETKADIINKREWISNLSKGKKIIPFNVDMKHMASEVIKHDIFPKRKRTSIINAFDIPVRSRVCTIM